MQGTASETTLQMLLSAKTKTLRGLKEQGKPADVTKLVAYTSGVLHTVRPVKSNLFSSKVFRPILLSRLG